MSVRFLLLSQIFVKEKIYHIFFSFWAIGKGSDTNRMRKIVGKNNRKKRQEERFFFYIQYNTEDDASQ